MEELGRVLDKAKAILNDGRQNAYGDLESTFDAIAGMWNWYMFDRGLWAGEEHDKLLGTDVAAMMALLKIVHASEGRTYDNVADACGYLGLFADLCTKKYGEENIGKA